MPFVLPKYSKAEVNKAGEILAGRAGVDMIGDIFKWYDAHQVLANWRGCHAYPINTFQATLRTKLSTIDPRAIVAQRLKRTPSIILKLKRFPEMQLARMQDIGGLRAVVGSVAKVRMLEAAYKTARFKHRLASSKDYINFPKPDGYRGIHLIYRYHSDSAPVYNGLSLELQLRTKLQHAWATAVETMGTFLGQALKSGQGEQAWRGFFAQTGAALALLERTAPVPGFEGKSGEEVFAMVAATEKKLNVLEKLRGFAIATDKITAEGGRGDYHLVVLNSATRSVAIKPYPKSDLERANYDYSIVEQRSRAGDRVEAVLVSAGPIDALRKAYPNYFLDTEAFVTQIERVIRLATAADADQSGT